MENEKPDIPKHVTKADTDIINNPLNCRAYMSERGHLMLQMIDGTEMLYGINNATTGGNKMIKSNFATLKARCLFINDGIIRRNAETCQVNFHMVKERTGHSVHAVIKLSDGSDYNFEIDNGLTYDLANNTRKKHLARHDHDKAEWEMIKSGTLHSALAQGCNVLLVDTSGKEMLWHEHESKDQAQMVAERINWRNTEMRKYKATIAQDQKEMRKKYDDNWGKW